MKKLNFLLVIAISVFLLQSCMKDQGDALYSKKAPELPSIESFAMPFNDFSEPRKDGINGRTIDNWLYSATNVLVWNTILTVHLNIPVLAFQHSFKHKAVYQGSGIWMWSYEVTDNLNKTYVAKLYAELLPDDEIKWDMYISQIGGFDNMHWYSGITAINKSYAHWTLNFDPADPKPCLKIDFNKNTSSASIRYTNIIPNVPQNGAYIEYREGAINAGDFNRAYDVFAAELNNLMQINWNSIYKNGRVKDFKKFADNEWHCWGTDFQDTVCN